MRRWRVVLGVVVASGLLAAVILFTSSRGQQRAFDTPDVFPDSVTADAATETVPLPPATASDRAEQLTRVIAGDAQRMWSQLFEQAGRSYTPATVVTYRDRVETACGVADGGVGPFTCPDDDTIYVDLGVYDDLRRSVGRGSDFAWAYVVAHEVGHRVQQQTGVQQRVAELRRRGPDAAAASGPSLRAELQADCYAGIWMHAAYPPELTSQGARRIALAAAQAAGNQREQALVGDLRPDTFGHGLLDQRVRWLSRGIDTGQPAACDTFALPIV